MFLDTNTGYFIPDIETSFEEFLDSVFDAYDLYPRTFLLSEEHKLAVLKSLSESISQGILFVDSDFTYEVVEFDSPVYDNRYDVQKKSRRDILKRHERIKKMREAFADELHKKDEEKGDKENDQT